MESDDDIPTLIDHSEGLATTTSETPQELRRTPCTIISGFLGAGKSTLLKRILTEKHGYRIAVIINEFGDSASIEAKAINVTSPDDPAVQSEEVLELANGCLCCSIKDAGIAAIEKLMQRKGTFDYIVLETTGLADPGPIASIFWQNEEYSAGLGREIILDGVVCVVDAVFGRTQMEEDHSTDGIGESLRQIACSDVVLLNKVDVVQSEKDLFETEDMIHRVNPSAPIYRTTHANIDISRIININAYRMTDHIRTTTLNEASANPGRGIVPRPKHYELRGISSLQMTIPPLSLEKLAKLEKWIQRVLWDKELPREDSSRDAHPVQILRCKGLFVTETEKEYILQGVQTMYEISEVNGQEVHGLPSAGKLVLIGKGLDEVARSSLLSVLM
ncbi:CobW/HypB/UreG, nucleotide-binding domain-containing protein [Pisolithus marmoratus]|nr:CobW/HypB/UreG, nucleotide-binding domain-containing protein [Pisolithus marmoratus]